MLVPSLAALTSTSPKQLWEGRKGFFWFIVERNSLSWRRRRGNRSMKQLVTLCLQSARRERWVLVHNSLSPLLHSLGPQPMTWPHIFRVDLPISDKLAWKGPHRHSWNCVLWWFLLKSVKLTAVINHPSYGLFLGRCACTHRNNTLCVLMALCHRLQMPLLELTISNLTKSRSDKALLLDRYTFQSVLLLFDFLA